MPKVSVIIPVYNVEKYLRQCLDSVVNQTLNDIEIICVDDGSTDNSLQILKEYAKKDIRIKVLEQENQGYGLARNKGLDIANGEYITFIIDKDIIESNMLEKMYNLAIKNKVSVVQADYDDIYEENGKKKTHHFLDDVAKLNIVVKTNSIYTFDIIKPICLTDVMFKTYGKLYKTEFLKVGKIKFNEDKYDYNKKFALEVSLSSDKVFYTNKILYHHIITKENLCTKLINPFTTISEIENLLNKYNLMFDLKLQFEDFKFDLLKKQYLMLEDSLQQKFLNDCELNLNSKDYLVFINILKQENSNKKIFLVCLKNKNLGDTVIHDTAKHLIKEIMPDAKIISMNLFPQKKIMNSYKNSNNFLSNIINHFSEKSNIHRILCFYKWWLSQKRKTKIYKYYKNNIKNANLVIFVGGGIIKYSREDFWNAIYSITTICQRKKVPTYFNAIGVEGFDAHNFYSNLIQYSLNKSCIKKITTRDDLKSLNKYVKDKRKIALVGDPALWVKETYEIDKNNDSDIIGIGIVRGKIFTDYGFDFDEDKIFSTYANLIKCLNKKGYKWQMFCNGLNSDFNMGLKILEYFNLPNDGSHLAKRPATSGELVSLISNYKAVIAARLHANIISLSLDIPSVGLVWNDKLKLFGEIFGIQNRFIEKDKFLDSEYIVSQLEEAVVNGYDNKLIEKMRKTTKVSLKNFILDYMDGNK